MKLLSLAKSIAHSHFEPQQAQRLVIFWLGFVAITAAYCLAYGWWVHGTRIAVAAAMACVARDWLLWVVFSPAFLFFAKRFDLGNPKNVWKLAALLIGCTLALAVVRLSYEASITDMSLPALLLIYLPRYFAVGGLILVAASFNCFWRKQMHKSNCAVANTPQHNSATLLVCKGNRKIPVEIDDIHHVTACGNYLEIHTAQETYLLRDTLKNIAQQLGAEFIQVHRSHLVRISAIAKVESASLSLQLNCGAAVRIGKTYLAQLLPHLHAYH